MKKYTDDTTSTPLGPYTVYACATCGERRVYGTGSAEASRTESPAYPYTQNNTRNNNYSYYQPLLVCQRERTLTRHNYEGIDAGWVGKESPLVADSHRRIEIDRVSLGLPPLETRQT